MERSAMTDFIVAWWQGLTLLPEKSAKSAKKL
jgi:hypothetical protein